MRIEPNYNGFRKFFLENRKGADKKYADLSKEFEDTFNEILQLGVGANLGAGQKRKGTVITLYLRGAKYLYTSYQLSLTGHTEESRALLRNTIELLMLGFLISKSDEVYSLWLECHELRTKNTDKYGNVDMELAHDEKFWVSKIRSKHRHILEESDEAQRLYKTWKEFSTRYSHENMYNIAVRIETNDGRTELYLGDGHDSASGRMSENLRLVLEVTKDVLSFMKNERSC